MKILKFGGSSVGNSTLVKKVVLIIEETIKHDPKISVVFSAFAKVTNQLIELGQIASSGDKGYQVLLKELNDRHVETAKDLISAQNGSQALGKLKNLFSELEDVLQGVYLVKELSLRTLDFIMSFGERFSAFIISEALKDKMIDCDYLDARKVITTDNHFGQAHIEFQETNRRIKDYFNSHLKPQIITGFIGSTVDNETTTFGRGGSDYSASIFGAALNASMIEIWTDVEGVMTADPRKVDKAFSIQNLTYEEAMELSHFGAEVIHPATMQPALDKKIPINIKSTFNPTAPGTIIRDKIPATKRAVKGISSIDDIALINVQGGGMVGVAGIANRIFAALAAKSINIILITQASSEHSVCFAVAPDNAELAKEAIEKELRLEILDKKVNEILVEKSLSIIAVVGENMRKTPGIAGMVFRALGQNGINIVAIAQGASELNISMVVAKKNEAKALNALHDAFFLSHVQTANLFMMGVGLIGATLLNQIGEQKDYLIKEYSLQLNIVGLANTRKMYFKREGIDPHRWNEEFDTLGQQANLDKFVETMKQWNLPNCIFIDCTASEEAVEHYLAILNSGISIAAPNKKANAGSYKLYQALKQAALQHHVRFLYEANVGAGLPVINTLKDMISGGDEIYKIEGVLSGTLSFIFNTFSAEKPFSETIREAQKKGYTEPDPREDLNGLDAARKLLILSREIGQQLELEDINVENLVPEPAGNVDSVEDFYKELKKYDAEFENRRKDAEANGCVLRYIASISDTQAEVSLKEVDQAHPFFGLSGSDNVFAITTKHCQDRPLVVQGPGAGAAVTATGVFADVIRIARFLNS